MRLTGVNMMGKKMVLGLNVCVFCSFVFSKNDVLWDFGVIITPPEYQNILKDNSLQPQIKQNNPNVKINAVISDPFIPPVKSTLSSHISGQINNNVSDKMPAFGIEKNIFQISNEAKRCFINNNYGCVVELLQQRNMSRLTKQHQKDLEYLFAEALYKTGKYKKARDQVLSLLMQNETDRLCLLLAMIYESLGQNNNAKEYYLKLISQYPKSDYTASAQIKSRILGRH